MEPSAKMLALIEQLRTAENAGDKTIVYSQCPSSPTYLLSLGIYFHLLMMMLPTWNLTGTSMLDLVETLLVRYGIQFLRYDGKMRTEAREAALIAFRKICGPRVILISTKCGGVGLNLTIANRVVK